MTRREHKRQHFVPASYLAAWSDPATPSSHEPYVWVFEKESREGRRKAPKNLFAEGDFYTETLPDGTRDVSLEKFLSRLETRFASIRQGVLAPRKELEPANRVLLAFFCAAMNTRTRGMREHIREQWSGLLEMMEESQSAALEDPVRFAALSTPSRPEDTTFTIDDVRYVANQPAQVALRFHLRVEAPVLAKMNCAVLCTDDDIGFITSDDPVVWFDPALVDEPAALRSPGLGSRTIEVTLPLRPQQLLFLSWWGPNGYVEATAGLVEKANRMVRSNAERQFVSRSSSVKEEWYV